MADKYTIIVEAILNKANIQQQLSGMKSTAKITVNNSDLEKRNRLIDQYNNKLELLQIRNKAAFGSDEVKKNADSLKSLIDAYDGTTAAKYRMQNASEKLTNSVAKFNSGIKNTNKDGMNAVDMFGLAAKKMVIWAIATEALYGTLKKIGEAIQYVKDLNKELTNIQIVTGASTKQVADLAVQYNALAKQTGSTTLEVAKGSVEWARQGKTVAETQKLLTASMMMSKLAAMDSADATEKLTAIMNGFNFEASQAQHVLDVLITLDNNYATSTNEIASAMQRSSNSAQLAGISYEQLASYITIISATTRKSSRVCQY